MFSSSGERAPGYRLSPSYFQKLKRVPAPDWAQKMLCIIVPNRRTASLFVSSYTTVIVSITACLDHAPGRKKLSCDARVWVLPKRQNKIRDIILDRQRDYPVNGGGRYTIGRREKWPEKVGRREK